MAKRSTTKTTAPRFGGDWTTTKLDVVAKYLVRYTTALKNKPSEERPFSKGYIDAFAGSGYRVARADPEHDAQQPLLFPDLAEDEPQALLDGSARRALKTAPPFDGYVFIERDAARCAELEKLKAEFPELAIQIRRGEANAEIRKICRVNWASRRAVMFLDPFGMQVEWTTIKAIAKTKAIDLWLLFPLGIGVNRLLKRSGEIPASWRKRLDLILGTKDWYEKFYRVEKESSLYGDVDRVVKASIDSIGAYFNERLRSVFAAVAQPKVLRSKTNCPLYLLCFAVGNRSGAPVALRIANHLLKEAG